MWSVWVLLDDSACHTTCLHDTTGNDAATDNQHTENTLLAVWVCGPNAVCVGVWTQMRVCVGAVGQQQIQHANCVRANCVRRSYRYIPLHTVTACELRATLTYTAQRAAMIEAAMIDAGDGTGRGAADMLAHADNMLTTC
jgi:hypothetical protein